MEKEEEEEEKEVKGDEREEEECLVPVSRVGAWSRMKQREVVD